MNLMWTDLGRIVFQQIRLQSLLLRYKLSISSQIFQVLLNVELPRQFWVGQDGARDGRGLRASGAVDASDCSVQSEISHLVWAFMQSRL